VRRFEYASRITSPGLGDNSHNGVHPSEGRAEHASDVGLIDLCSTYSVTGVSTAQLREISSSAGDAVTPRLPRVRRSWTRLSDDVRADVVARYGAGETSTTLADEYGVAKSTILGILRANNVVVRRQPLEPAVVTESVRLYESGLSLSQVAARLEINQETMRVAIINAGAHVRPPTGM
jgi:hypothetical protein